MSRKLKMPCCLIKTPRYMYKRGLDDLFVKKDFDSVDEYKLEFDCNNYCLNEIAENLTVFTSQIGNHWTFLTENSDEIASYIFKFINSNKPKL